ncbi:uncharacterized protein CLUP02_14054 [Colletotrichum lupini]|uniref:Uncharacterized protein n=1 Tax=Colletotrichum lupini TaxID=145971 RepID=A0A9Q8T3A3_9PEZI|nr:uncharacterized protein CLUP02_14054 [Colletotrichum lupini]UQC88529.1 hypothetical protein CLUP02_14054 [Colletotrichum lupini]
MKLMKNLKASGLIQEVQSAYVVNRLRRGPVKDIIESLFHV